MTTTPSAPDSGWAPPEACTLPTAEQPLRVAEFDELFATSLVELEDVQPTYARLRMSGGAGLLARVQDLIDRESACCSFFTFTATPVGSGARDERVTLEIRVPDTRADVLAGLVARTQAT